MYIFNTKTFSTTYIKVLPFHIFFNLPALVPVGKISKLSHNLLLYNAFLLCIPAFNRRIEFNLSTCLKKRVQPNDT